MRIIFLYMLTCCLFSCDNKKPAEYETPSPSDALNYIEQLTDANDGTTNPVFCEQIFLPQAKDKYVTMLDAFYVGRDAPPLVVSKYRQLFERSYAAKIANSKISLMQNKKISSKFLLQQKVNGPNAHRVKVTIEPTAYDYKQNQVYVDFANRFIGGGVLWGGFVQEELEMLVGTFLPYIAQVRKTNKSSVDFCPEVDLINLDTTPALIEMRIFLDMHLQGIYGDRPTIYKNPGLLTDLNIGSYYTVKNAPVDIFTIAVAATNFNAPGPREYSVREIADMTMAAAKGFYLAIEKLDKENLPIIINTGNWGAGVFANSIYMAYAMQYFAIVAATELYVKNHPSFNRDIQYVYNAFDAESVDMAKSAKASLDSWVTSKAPAALTVKEAIFFMYEQSKRDPLWRKS